MGESEDNMRTEKEMLDLILTFADSDENIRAVVMNGSRANPSVKKDIFQDFDIACLVNDLAPYVRNDRIPAYFGEMLILQEPDNMQDPPPEGNGHYAYLMQFMDGNRIDLSFHVPERWKSVTDDSLTIVLLDKDNCLGEIPPSSDIDYLPKPPTQKQFQDCCNEFWWMNPYVAKGLWRGELTYAKWMMEVVQEQLMDMLTWYFGIKTDFRKAAGKQGKYIRGNVEPEIWTDLEKTYSDSNFENNWESLFTAGSLFRRVAKVVAEHFEFQYPQRDDDNVSAYVRHIKSLPKDSVKIY
jgi:aminoglycoside 6-adenylyltransferase